MNNILKFEDFLLESSKFYPFSQLEADLAPIGFVYIPTKSGFAFRKTFIDKEGKKRTIEYCSHKKKRGIVDPQVLTGIKDKLKEEYWITGDYSDIDAIDDDTWKAWGVKKPTKSELDNPTNRKESEEERLERENKEELERLEKEKIEDEIRWSNFRWNKIEINPNYMLNIYNFNALEGVFIGCKQEKNRSKTNEIKRRYSLFRSTDDRRPMCGWYDDVYEDGNDERLETGFGFVEIDKNNPDTFIVHPILKDGTISDNTFEF